jgi:enoyl-CoA hydratase/carnithine racemase
MSYENILYSIDDGIATITFNRPKQLNAMNRLMMAEITDALGRINTDSNVRVALITGEGKAFMAGADIKEYAQQTPEEFEAFQTAGRNLYASIEGNAKPIIAAINGYAFGGGLEIALACDMIVATETALMGLPEILLNLIPGGGGTQRLAAKVGQNRANEILMSGRNLSAEEAHQWGLINHLYPAQTFQAASLEFAKTFTDKNPAALRVLKQLSQLGAGGPMNTAAQCLENEALNRFYHSEAGQAKVQEFYQASLERERKRAAEKAAQSS